MCARFPFKTWSVTLCHFTILPVSFWWSKKGVSNVPDFAWHEMLFMEYYCLVYLDIVAILAPPCFTKTPQKAEIN